jgi:hypothetical protein
MAVPYATRRCPRRTNFVTVYLMPTLATGVELGPGETLADELELAAVAPNASTAVAANATRQM